MEHLQNGSEYACRSFCFVCKQTKLITAFNKGNKRPYGTHAYCKDCARTKSTERYAIHREFEVTRAKQYRDKLKNTFIGKLRNIINNSAVDRSSIRLEWAAEQIKAADYRCAITGIPFEYTDNRSARSLSIDKIDPSKGYTEDNVRFVCWCINAAMGDWGLETLKEVLLEWKNNKEM